MTINRHYLTYLELNPEPGPLAILAGAAFALLALWVCTVFLFSL